jgi:hypothetical protein
VACCLAGPALAQAGGLTADTLLARPDADAGPTTVHVGMWLENIHSIDSVAQTFEMNIFVSLRWHDPRLAHQGGPTGARHPLDEIWHPRVHFLNGVGWVRTTLPEEVVIEPDGTVFYSQGFVGKVSERFDLTDFPFDRQLLRIHVVSPGDRLEDLRFVPDERISAQGLEHAAAVTEEVSLPDWEIRRVEAQPLPYGVGPKIQVPGYALEVAVARASGHYIWKVILPLLMIVIMSWTVFWIDPAYATSQISVATTSMLTLIAYRFTVGAHVPRVPYMTRMDTYLLLCSLLVLLALLQVILTTGLARMEGGPRARMLDRASRVLFPLAFVAIVIVSFVA